MEFNGSVIRQKAQENGLTLAGIAQDIGVSRQAVNGWIAGAVPRGSYLVRLCALLNIKPNDLFVEPADKLVTVPLHRTIRKKKVSAGMRSASQTLAGQYLNLFRQLSTAEFLPVVRVRQRDQANAAIIAEQLRKRSGVDEGKPMDYASAFTLLSNLGVYTIFCEFPDTLKQDSYAFYSRIAGHRVVFVNIDTSPLDLIYYLLHETVHAIRDENEGAIDTDDEESFCDMVAELTQFPDFYINTVALIVAECASPSIIVKRMKEISLKNNHSLFGLYFRLVHMGKMPEGVQIGGAATNLAKRVPSIRQILFSDEDPRHYVDMLYTLSPNFMKVIEQQIAGCTVRKFGEWLGLNTSEDAQLVMDEIRRRKNQM